MQARYEVAGVLWQNKEGLKDIASNSWQLRTLSALMSCRTHLLGGHIDTCSNPGCKHVHISYNSCRNRHCPKCQGHKTQEWITERENELLNVPYYHIVFTLPASLNRICLYRPKMVYTILFKTAWSVLGDFASNPRFIGAKTGMIAILHTWGQNLSLHPHLHCIVPGGGITINSKWKASKGKDKYLFPVKSLSKVFRARFVEELRKHINLPNTLYKELFSKQWVVYCKQPFFGPQQVVEYLGRYTHKIAISNHRIQSTGNGKVSFTAKDYRKGGKKHVITLTEQEFIRRFCLHILPKGFTRIRHYGILSSALKKKIIPLLQQELGKPVLKEKLPVHRVCPKCRKGSLVTLLTFKGRAPPREKVIERLKNLFPDKGFC
jgi:hypothetical protein